MIKEDTISILTPTRNRPNNCERFIKTIDKTSFKHERIELFFYVDNDDPSLEAYKSLAAHCDSEYRHFKKIDFTFGEPVSVSISWNTLAEKSSSYLYIMGNDDLVYNTPGWDSLLIQNLAVKFRESGDPYWISWVNDSINGKRHCAFPIMTREWYKTVGYFAPGVFHFGYNDTWVFDIAKQLGRTNYIPNIENEHLHFSKGKSQMDDTYAHNRTGPKGNLYAKDKGIFNRQDMVLRRKEDVEKLRKQITKYQSTKLVANEVEDIPEYDLVFVQDLKKEWAATSHKLKEDPTRQQEEKYQRLCDSIKKNGMTYPILIDSENRVLRGNQRAWYCLDNNIKYISCYRIKDSDIDKFIQKTYIDGDDYPL
tara:strand:+ start:1202 stop:2299 length:1098 start_codon:yes stop_codon:yes gene_type:complete